MQAGKIRIGLFSTQYTKDPATGELRSVRVDIARPLAERIGVQAVLIEHRTPPEAGGCIKAGACDVVFLPLDERATNVSDFSFPFFQSGYTMLVPQAEVILGENEHAAFELLRAGRADAFASTRQLLIGMSNDLSGRACCETATARTSTGWSLQKAMPGGSPM